MMSPVGSCRKTLADQSVRELLEAVGAQTPAPGGGAAAALTASMAAGLVQMAARFTRARDDYAQVHERMDEVAEEAGTLRERLLELGERELSAYEPVLEAFALEGGDPEHEARLRAALSDAADSPLEIARAAAVVASLGAELALIGNTNLIGDAITGTLLAEAACCAAARLTEINLARVPSDPRLDEAAELTRQASAARAKALGGKDGTQ
jgi:formiminotetrahydrofolate cyclodeaminase